jgi:6-phosphogluconolactonase
MRSRWLLALFFVAAACDSDDKGGNGSGGTAGNAASGGVSGASGRGGSAGGGAGGSSATGGSSGTGGSVGSAGSAGAAGSAGTAGTAGTNGASGASGTGGSAGSAGASGTGGATDAGPDAPAAQRSFVYTGSGNGTISIFRLDRATGALMPAGTAVGGTNPSFLAWDPARRFLFAVNEGSPGNVVAFSINQTTGALTRLNQESSTGDGPAHVSVDRQGRWVLVANYNGGNAAVLPIGQDGKLAAQVDTESFGGGSQAHMILTSPDNRYAYVPCKGRDIVAQFAFEVATGALTALTPPTVTFPAGTGPRHLDFHPSGRFAYLVGEVNSTLTALAVNTANGTMSRIETESSLPSGFTGSNTGADVHVSPDGRFVYSSNRGHNSIAIFSIDQAMGSITLVTHQPTGGNTPRNFHIDPSGTFLLAANQDSGTVVVFRIGPEGRLTSTGNAVNVNAPAFVGVVIQQ